MQIATLGIPALTALAIAIAVMQAVTVLVLRAHWTMDVLAGIFAALAIGLLVI